MFIHLFQQRTILDGDSLKSGEPQVLFKLNISGKIVFVTLLFGSI